MIKQVIVTDSDSRIPVTLLGQPQTIEGATLETGLNYKVNHHNNCDSFVLKTISATYSFHGAPKVGACGPIIPGAPSGIQDWKIRYASGGTASGHATFRHYIWNTLINP